MRQITIDFSADQSGMISAFGGYDGEHNETKVVAVLPPRMLGDEVSDYRFIFQTSNGEEIYSAPMDTDDLEGGTVSVMLHQQLTTAPEVRFCVSAYRYKGEEYDAPVLVAKTATARLSILYPSTGEPTPPFLDPFPVPQGVKVRTAEDGIRGFDEASDREIPSEKAVAKSLANLNVSIEVDADLSATSENPVQNKVIANSVANALKGIVVVDSSNWQCTIDDISPFQQELTIKCLTSGYAALIVMDGNQVGETLYPDEDGYCRGFYADGKPLTFYRDIGNFQIEYNKDTNKAMGDVESALDAIIAMQNQLIGGDSV